MRAENCQVEKGVPEGYIIEMSSVSTVKRVTLAACKSPPTSPWELEGESKRKKMEEFVPVVSQDS